MSILLRSLFAVIALAVVALVATPAAPAQAASETQTYADAPWPAIAVDGSSLQRHFSVWVVGRVTSIVIEIQLQSSSDGSCPDFSTTSTQAPGQMGATLTAPDGTALTLIRAADGGTDGSYVSTFVGEAPSATTRFDPWATTVVGSTNGGIPESGVFQPAGGAISAFNGIDPNGSWTLTITDSAAPGATCYSETELWVTTGWGAVLEEEREPAAVAVDDEQQQLTATGSTGWGAPERGAAGLGGLAAVLVGVGLIGIGLIRAVRAGRPSACVTPGARR